MSLFRALMISTIAVGAPVAAQDFDPAMQAYVDAVVAYQCILDAETTPAVVAASGLPPAEADAVLAEMLDWGLAWQDDNGAVQFALIPCAEFERQDERAAMDRAVAWMTAMDNAQAADWFAAIMAAEACTLAFADTSQLTRRIEADIASDHGLVFEDVLVAEGDPFLGPFFDAADGLVARGSGFLIQSGRLVEGEAAYTLADC